MTRTIWHYTCDHGAPGIRSGGVVVPNHHPLLGVELSWFTDLERSHRHEAGLTSARIACDRMAHRFAVADPAGLIWWPRAARVLAVPRAVRDELEEGRLLAHWWVAFGPVEVIT
ncbi:hypothetical protein [Actinomadura formosensis]|uniref:hypothetical protein n=1 Tax=Actinomadura formosensis TaxID=60706 RepID=UPI003D8F2C1B